jgi:hypothetical protein
MNLTRYNQRFYTTPHYAVVDSAPAVFAVRLMPLAPVRPAHAIGNYAGLRRRFAGASMLRAQNHSNVP